jgi:hypothetical protein
MKNLAVAAAAALFSLGAVAQGLPQCLNPDVLNALVYNGRIESKATVTRTLPATLVGFRAPSGFSLIGTAVRDSGRATLVAFKTALSSEQAMSALTESLRADGWAPEAPQGPGQTFTVPGEPQYVTVCRNSERRSLVVRDVGGVRYANISLTTEQRSLACNEKDPRMGGMDLMAMQSSMPKFTFPSTTRQAGPGGGGGGSNDIYRTATRIQSPDSGASLAEHLAGQLTAQGWKRDSAWNGTVSSGSNWKRQADGKTTWGTLEIVRMASDMHDVRFTVQTKTP